MSWDVYLIKSETNQESSPDEIEKPLPIAAKSEVHAWLRQNYPEADFTDPNWPVVFTDNYSVEIMLEEEEVQNDIMLAIRGNEAPYDLIEAMCQAFACRAVDTGTGGFWKVRKQLRSKAGKISGTRCRPSMKLPGKDGSGN